MQQNALASVSFQGGVCVSPTTAEYLHSYFLLCWQQVFSKIILELEEDFFWISFFGSCWWETIIAVRLTETVFLLVCFSCEADICTTWHYRVHCKSICLAVQPRFWLHVERSTGDTIQHYSVYIQYTQEAEYAGHYLMLANMIKYFLFCCTLAVQHKAFNRSCIKEGLQPLE